MNSATAPATSGRGWGDEEQARLYRLAGIPPVHEVNGVPKRNGIRFLIHPILAMGGWATYEADGLGSAFGERAFGVKPILQERFSAHEAVEAHLIHRERSAFDPWVIRSTKGLGMRHHRALVYLLLDTADQICDWSLSQLEAFMANPDGRIVVTTGRKGLRQITAAKTYEEGRTVIQDLFGLSVSQATYTRRRAKAGGGDDLNITWTNRQIIMGTSEAFQRGITLMNGREVDTVTIGYSSYLVAAPQEITVAKDLVPWLWSSAQALRRQGIRPSRLQERLDDEDSLMLRQALLWDALAPLSWKVHDLFAGFAHESEFLADIFGTYERKKTRSSWLSANRKKEKRERKVQSEPIGPLYDESVTVGSTLAPQPELGSDQPWVAATAIQVAEHNEFSADYSVVDSCPKSPCNSMVEGAEVSLLAQMGAEVSLEPSKVSPKGEILSQEASRDASGVMELPSKKPCESRSEGAEVSLAALKSVQGAEVSLENSKVSLGGSCSAINTSDVEPGNLAVGKKGEFGPKPSGNHTSAPKANLDQIALEASKVSLGAFCKANENATSEGGVVPSSPSPSSSKQGKLPSVAQTDGDLLACLPAGEEKERVEKFKERIKGLSGIEIHDLLGRGVLGTWESSAPHERKCLLDLICSVEEEGFTLSRSEAERMVSGGILTARGCWAMVMCLKRRSLRGGRSEAICKSPHFNMRNWLSGNFLTRTGERNAFYRDFLGIITHLEALGWYERPIRTLSPQARAAMGSLDRLEVKGLPLPEDERKEQAAIASQRAQEAQGSTRSSIPTPEAFLATEGGREALLTLKDLLTQWMSAQSSANAAWRNSRVTNRALTPAEEALMAEASRLDKAAVDTFSRIGSLRLRFGMAHGADRTQWRSLLTELERLL
jgi:hypothetical protein